MAHTHTHTDRLLNIQSETLISKMVFAYLHCALAVSISNKNVRLMAVDGRKCSRYTGAEELLRRTHANITHKMSERLKIC